MVPQVNKFIASHGIVRGAPALLNPRGRSARPNVLSAGLLRTRWGKQRPGTTPVHCAHVREMLQESL